MLVASISRSAIDGLKTQLSKEFEMKDLGEAKRILGMEIGRDKEKETKPVSVPLGAHLKLLADISPKIVKDRELILKTPYVSVVGSLMYVMGALKEPNRKHYGNISEQSASFKNSMGERITDREMIVNEFISYYKNLMGTAVSTSNPSIRIIQNDPCLNKNQCRSLSVPVSKDKIKHVVFSMPDNKSPGPDGYGAAFFKSVWSVVGEEVTLAIEIFFKTWKLLGAINSTSITLIPKAFDTISWNFIEEMLKGLCFPSFLSSRIMTCISSPKYSISLNDSIHGYFKGERGLRSLDLLKQDRSFKFHPKCGRLNITHLIFADDLLLFCKGGLSSIQKLYQCVTSFSEVSALKANPNKCAIFYEGVTEPVKDNIKEFLGFTEGSMPIRYLGIPLVCKRLTY
ncbi:uncharacterized protein LOC109823170 [Asparagus officinalis]|uniref:uncharacterized protein LOC109823170 n=1 Tax=Asparagus officinalis TaxID=4686 RepID=UPI00098E0061|nr:uncharacterized protein LOC109823170 [Asparagus officinalis]